MVRVQVKKIATWCIYTDNGKDYNISTGGFVSTVFVESTRLLSESIVVIDAYWMGRHKEPLFILITYMKANHSVHSERFRINRIFNESKNPVYSAETFTYCLNRLSTKKWHREPKVSDVHPQMYLDVGYIKLNQFCGAFLLNIYPLLMQRKVLIHG